MSERAQKIYACLILPSPQGGEGPGVRAVRQQTLADQLGCSRRSIGRALKELKEAGLLVDLNKRHQNRCKLYEIKIPLNPPFSNGEEKGEQQLKLYRQTFEAVFRKWPAWEKHYPQVTRELPHGLNPDQLFRQTFDKLYALRDSQEVARL